MQQVPSEKSTQTYSIHSKTIQTEPLGQQITFHRIEKVPKDTIGYYDIFPMTPKRLFEMLQNK